MLSSPPIRSLKVKKTDHFWFLKNSSFMFTLMVKVTIKIEAKILDIQKLGGIQVQ